MNPHVRSRPALGRLLAAYACSSVAIGLPWPLLLVLVWDRYGDGPHGPLVVGLAGAARMAPYVLFSWAVGSLGDHVRRDRLVVATAALRLMFLLAAAVAVAGDRVGLGVLAAALAVLSGTPAYPTIAASLPALAGPHRARATELLVTIEVSAWVVGPAVGGLLLAQSLRPWTLVVAAALAALGLVFATGITIPGPVEKAPDALAGMLREVLRCRPALSALGLAGLLNVVVTVAGLALLPLSEDSWGRGDAGFGIATACLGFGALGAPVLARLAGSVGGATTTRGLATIGVAVALVAATPLPWPALPMLALAGAAGVVVESLLTGTLQDAVPDRYRAGALGLADTVMVGACLVGSLVAPSLARYAGARPALLLVALAALLPVLAVRLLPYRRPRTPYDASSERTPAGPDPRGAPAVGAARVG
jgi:MFS family permease